MEFFNTAKTVRLLSHHKTYLAANPDYGEDSIRLVKGSAAGRTARWTIELSSSKDSIYLRSSTNRYLAASDKRFLLGAAGRRVVLLPRPEPSAEWRPIRDGRRFKLQTQTGTFLRGNGVMKPYRGVVTHDVPHRTITQEWVLWNIDVLELRISPSVSLPTVSPAPNLREGRLRTASSSAVSVSVRDPDECSVLSQSTRGDEDEEMSLSDSESDSPISSPVRRAPSIGLSVGNQGRTIIYYVMNDKGEVDDDEEGSFIFQGSSVEDLRLKLEELTGIHGVILCIRDIINDRLLRLRLNLPPNRKSMAIIVVPSSSIAASRLEG